MRISYAFFVAAFIFITYGNIGFISDKTWKVFLVATIKSLSSMIGVILALIGLLLCM